MKKIKVISSLLLSATAPICFSASTAAKTDKKNVLFIIVDDLRPELNCYGQSDMITPNIDRLSQNGVQFNQAFCNIPVSGASRASLMTGLRPTRERWWDVTANIDKEAPGVTTLPKFFKEQGYTTISNSKVIHGKKDAADSWSEIWTPKGRGSWRNYLGEENLVGEEGRHGATAYEALDVEDDAYFDGATAKKTIQDLQKLKKEGNPFFLAVGILKPHLPFNSPKKYWDLYKPESIQLPDNYEMDRSGFPDQAFHTWNELRFYKNIPDKGSIPDKEEAKRLIHGYKACVTYSDAQIGLIIDELKRLGLDKNTVVMLIGDHGWSLGNHGDWCKHSNFSVVNRSPMIISSPDLPKQKQINEIVEYVDIYPTLCDLTGFTPPAHNQGESLKALALGKAKNWKNRAVVKWHTGVSLMTPEYRYTEWYNKANNEVEAQMLFRTGDDQDENKNLAKKAEFAPLLKKLSGELSRNWGKEF